MSFSDCIIVYWVIFFLDAEYLDYFFVAQLYTHTHDSHINNALGMKACPYLRYLCGKMAKNGNADADMWAISWSLMQLAFQK